MRGTHQLTQRPVTGRTVVRGLKAQIVILEEKFKLVRIFVAAKHTLMKNMTTFLDHDTVLPYSFCLVL